MTPGSACMFFVGLIIMGIGFMMCLRAAIDVILAAQR